MSSTNTKINIIYYNDVHSSTKYLEAFKNFRNDFYNNHPTETNLTLCGGDILLDKNTNNEIVAQELGAITDALSIGNHDLEAGNYITRLIKRFKLNGKFLSINLDYTKETPLKTSIHSHKIIDIKDKRIGLIGISPLDFNEITYMNRHTDFIHVKPIQETIQRLKEEVSILQANKVDIIILLAHTGNFNKQNGLDYYKTLSKVGGISLIIGGHDHIETDRWESSDKNELVRIVATGRNEVHSFGENLDYVGILELEFDENNKLIKDKCSNQFVKLKATPSVQSGKIIFKLDRPLKESNILLGHSEIGNLIADSNLWYINKYTQGEKADFAFVNAGTVRDNFDNTIVTESDVKSALPFTTSKLMKGKITKAQIVNTLTWCAKSTTFGKITPGIMHVSNMEYTINPDLSISNINILNNDGSIKYKLDEFPEDAEFTIAYDIFLATGVAGLKDLKRDIENDKNIEIFSASRQDALFQYLTDCPELYNYEKTRIHLTKVLTTALGY